ncbi:MAG TPA: S-layer homology domain-containing protein [Bacillota bacterium]|nr:S-layer homology domain-containing protein [Bacillota bacterium]
MEIARKRFFAMVLCVILTIAMLPLDALIANSSAAPAEIPSVATDDTYGDQAEHLSSSSNGSGLESPNPFGDIKPDDWFFDDVAFVYTNGIMKGTGTKQLGSAPSGAEMPMFSPNMPMSRAMLVTVLYRLSGSPDTLGLPNQFSDVSEGSWYENAVAWAAANRIITGIGGNLFAPDVNITREQAATVFLRYARFAGKGPSHEVTGGLDFEDEDKISDWALEGSIWCTKAGIIKGKPHDNGLFFDPQGNATRAEIASMLHRFSDNVLHKPVAEQPATGSYLDTESGDFVRVSFETNGGSAIDPVFLPRGGTLPDVSYPLKDDYTFTGWYTDTNLTQPFFSDASITDNMLLYASYAAKDYDYKEYVDPVKFLPECEDDVTFEVLSPEILDEGDLDDYLTITNKANGDEIPSVTVRSLGGNVYLVSPNAPYKYTPGDTYELSLIQDILSFSGEKEEIRTIAFGIKKSETYDVQFEDGVLYLLWSQVNLIDTGVYSMPKSLAQEKGITVGTTICLTDEIDSSGQGILNENSKIRNVLSIVDTDSTIPPRVMIFTEPSDVEDVYEQLDVYLKQAVNPDKLAGSIDVAKIVEDLESSEGTMQFTKLLAMAINESQTIDAMNLSASAPPQAPSISAFSSPFAEPVENNDKISITANALVSGLTISASVGTARNTNFPGAVDSNWVVLTINFDYDTTIKKVQINADFTFKELITLSTGTKTGLNLSNGLYFDAWIDAYSQTDMEFNVLVKTVDVDEEFLNITDEIQNLIDGFTKDNSDVPEVIRNVLGAKGDYIDLVKVNLFEQTQDIKMPIPILQLKVSGDFVVRLNLAVGLSAQSTFMSASRVGIRGSTSQGLETYRYGLEGDGRQSLDLYCAGYLGLKSGMRLTLSVNFYGLESLGKVGFMGEVGAYMDIYGFLQLHLVKAGGTTDINSNGGVYMEVGIYLELEIFAESESLHAKADVSLLDLKFPVYTLGNRYVLYRFKNAGRTVVINQNDYYLSSSGLLDCEMLDLTTGELVKGDHCKLKNFHFTISNPWMIDWMDENHIHVQPQYFGRTYYGVRVPKGAQSIDGKVQVYYGGDNLCFSSREKGYTYNEINIVWIDPSIDPKTVNLDAVTATYVVNLDGQRTTVATKSVLAGNVPGSIDLSSWLKDAVITGYENDYDAAIWKDTTYTINITKLQVLVSYMYLEGGIWRYEIYAIESGDVMPLPAGSQSPDPGLIFENWMRRDFKYIDYEYLTNSRTALTVDNMHALWEWWDFTCTGYPKTGPIYTFTGTLDECYEKLGENQEVMPVLYNNVAQYQTKFVGITFDYPRMNYTAYGQNFDVYYNSDIFWFRYGSTPLPPVQKTYPGCTIEGWSHRYVAAADYAYDELPPATESTYYNLIVEFTQRRIVFKTDMGTFVDGSTVADSHMIPYPDYLKYVEDFQNANNALTMEPVLKDDVLYRFYRWDVDYSQDQEHIQTWNAVWVRAPGQEFAATFNAGEGAAFPDGSASVSLSVTYGSTLNLASFNPVKAPDLQYSYMLAGWTDQDGNIYGPTETIVIKKNMTYAAFYTPSDRTYTVSVSAGNGEFSDGTDMKTFVGKYGEETNISESIGSPIPPLGNASYRYEFDGWSEDLPETFTSDMSIVAKYRQISNEYTIIFDAGTGFFEGGLTTVSQTYHYGEVIVPPHNPTKPGTEYFTYEFTNWTPILNEGDSVTGNRTYTANYISTPTGTTLPESGITVTDGEVIEDISVGSIFGYTYEMVETFDGTYASVLTIEGDGLTFSGQGEDVYVDIKDTVSLVTFEDLSISFAQVYFDGINIGEGAQELTVNIEGNCAFEVTVSSDEAQHVMRTERPVGFYGTDRSEDFLSIITSGGKAIYTSNNLTFDRLGLTIDAGGGGIVDEQLIYLLSADIGEEEQYVCRFVYSEVYLESDGYGFMLGSIGVEIEDGILVMDCERSAGFLGNLALGSSDVAISAGSGLWVEGEAVFSGDSRSSFTSQSGAAICARTGITVPAGYDLGGTSIQSIEDPELGVYYTFASEVEGGFIPAQNVKINYD